METPESSPSIGPGTVVTLHYKLFGDDSQVLDASEDDPILYLHGADNVVNGLEDGLTGHHAGEQVEVVVGPEDGYGERADGGIQKVGREHFPDDVELEPGMPLGAEGPDGETLTVWVVEVSDDEVTIDLNHPLAGKTLRFEVAIEGVRSATAEELEAGRPLQA